MRVAEPVRIAGRRELHKEIEYICRGRLCGFKIALVKRKIVGISKSNLLETLHVLYDLFLPTCYVN